MAHDKHEGLKETSPAPGGEGAPAGAPQGSYGQPDFSPAARKSALRPYAPGDMAKPPTERPGS